jgi:Arc/MetJ-type ribon-helix-helix transcriptional regulator
MPEDSVSIKIPKKLHGEIVKRVKESQGEFKDAQEYVEFVLTELVKEEEPASAYTPKQEEEIKKRLKQLGYL